MCSKKNILIINRIRLRRKFINGWIYQTIFLQENKCTHNEFTCASDGLCIPIAWKCDGQKVIKIQVS